MQVDLTKAAALRGVDLGEIQSFAKGSDPRETLDYLRSISGELTRIGTEDVRGVPTAHYFAAVDWQKALARAAKESGQQGFLAQLQSMPTALASIPVDVWVDADNLVRRMKMSFVFASPGQSQQAKAAMEMELFDYGKPVTVEAPPRLGRGRRVRAPSSRLSGAGTIAAWPSAVPQRFESERVEQWIRSNDLIPRRGSRRLPRIGRRRLDVPLARARRARLSRLGGARRPRLARRRSPTMTRASAGSAWARECSSQAARSQRARARPTCERSGTS